MAIIATGLEIAFWSIVIPLGISILRYIFAGFFYTIVKQFFRILDILQDTFRKLAGLDTVYVEGEATSGDIVSVVLKNSVIIDALISVAIFGLGLVIVASIVQMVRLEYTTEGSKNSKEKVFGNALKSLIMFILIPVVCFFGIRLSNLLLKAVDAATSVSGNNTVSGGIFVASSYDACKVYSAGNESVDNGIGIFNLVTWALSAIDPSYSNAQLEKDGKVVGDSDPGAGEYNIKKFKDIKITANNSYSAREKMTQKVNSIFADSGGSFWQNNTKGKTVADFGGETGGLVMVLSESDNLSYLNTEAVRYFYNLNQISYLMIVLGSYLTISALFTASMGLVVRIYNLAALFIISPAAIGLQPIDDGNAYKKWRGAFISNVLSAYGVIISLNIYFIVIGIISNIKLYNIGLIDSFIQFMFVCAGSEVIKSLSKLISSAIGAGDALEEGKGAVAAAGNAAGVVTKTIGGAASLATSVRTGVAGAMQQRKINKMDKDMNVLDKTGSTKSADGKWKDKDGNEIKDKNKIRELEDLKTRQDNARNWEATKGKKTREAAQRNKIVSTQSANRFMTAIKTSKAVTTLNQMTGNPLSYLDGSAYKDADSKTAQQLKEAGIDPSQAMQKGIAPARSEKLMHDVLQNKVGMQKRKFGQIKANQEKLTTHAPVDEWTKEQLKSIKPVEELAENEEKDATSRLKKIYKGNKLGTREKIEAVSGLRMMGFDSGIGKTGNLDQSLDMIKNLYGGFGKGLEDGSIKLNVDQAKIDTLSGLMKTLEEHPPVTDEQKQRALQQIQDASQSIFNDSAKGVTDRVGYDDYHRKMLDAYQHKNSAAVARKEVISAAGEAVATGKAPDDKRMEAVERAMENALRDISTENLRKLQSEGMKVKLESDGKIKVDFKELGDFLSEKLNADKKDLSSTAVSEKESPQLLQEMLKALKDISNKLK